MDLDLIRRSVRWIAFLAIFWIMVVAVRPYLVESGPPPVPMPGGAQIDDGVSQDLDTAFALLLGVDNSARLHFVVQFSRELTSTEIDEFSAQNGLALDGPIPENAYYTSTRADNWLSARRVLTSGQPDFTKIFEVRKQDRLSPQIRSDKDPAVVDIPPHALLNPLGAEIFVRFFR